MKLIQKVQIETLVGRASLWRPFLIVAEFVLVFGLVILADRLIFGGGELPGVTPEALGVAVVILAVQRGVAGGIAAATLATAIWVTFSGVAAPVGSSYLEYKAMLSLQPTAWFGLGVLIGALRGQQAQALRRVESSLEHIVEERNLLMKSFQAVLAKSRILEAQIAAGRELQAVTADASQSAKGRVENVVDLPSAYDRKRASSNDEAANDLAIQRNVDHGKAEAEGSRKMVAS